MSGDNPKSNVTGAGVGGNEVEVERVKEGEGTIGNDELAKTTEEEPCCVEVVEEGKGTMMASGVGCSVRIAAFEFKPTVEKDPNTGKGVIDDRGKAEDETGNVGKLDGAVRLGKTAEEKLKEEAGEAIN